MFVVIAVQLKQRGLSICPKVADGMANSKDPDQTVPLIWVCTVW